MDTQNCPYLRWVYLRSQDPSLLLLIQRPLKAGCVEAGQFVFTEQGTPQGGNLSPILADVCLHYVLDLWFEKKVKPQMHGICHPVHYAGDVLCLVQYRREAQYMEQAMRQRFANFDLPLHPERSRCPPSTNRESSSVAKSICTDLRFRGLDQMAIHGTITPHIRKGTAYGTN